MTGVGVIVNWSSVKEAVATAAGSASGVGATPPSVTGVIHS